MCAKLGQLEDVKKHCDDALKIDEKSFKALMRRGMNHVELKNFDLAEADYKAAAAIQPDSTGECLYLRHAIACSAAPYPARASALRGEVLAVVSESPSFNWWTALKRAMNELRKIRKQQRAEDKKVAEKMMSVSARKPANKGLTKAERKAAEEYDAKSNIAAAQRLGAEVRIAQAVEFLLQPVRPAALGTAVAHCLSLPPHTHTHGSATHADAVPRASAASGIRTAGDEDRLSAEAVQALRQRSRRGFCGSIRRGEHHASGV